VKPKVGLDGVFGCRGDEGIHRRLNCAAAQRVQAARRQRRGLGLHPDPEVDHVEHVLMAADRGGFHGERRRLGYCEHE